MGRFQFDLATSRDDADLRTVLAATPMDGTVSVSMQREPSFFGAAAVEGDSHQVIVCRDQRENRIAGFGCRSIRTLFVNGKPEQIGYLSGLRALPEYRNRGLVARGYAALRKLHADGQTRHYLTTIAEGNEQALKILTSSRAGLPRYRSVGRYFTIVIPISRRIERMKQDSSVIVRPAMLSDHDRILDFWNTTGRVKQFFPRYRSNDLFGNGGLLRDLAPDDLWLAIRDDAVIGTLGGWDQKSFKQAIVERYTSHLRWSRPIYNAWASLFARPRLPKPGNRLQYLTAAVPVVKDNDPVIFSALLENLLAAAVSRPCSFLTIGFHENDPLLSIASRLQIGRYVTRIYVVDWDDQEPPLDLVANAPVYLELGSL